MLIRLSKGDRRKQILLIMKHFQDNNSDGFVLVWKNRFDRKSKHANDRMTIENNFDEIRQVKRNGQVNLIANCSLLRNNLYRL